MKGSQQTDSLSHWLVLRDMNFTSVISSLLPRKIEINASTSQNVHMNATINVAASCTCIIIHVCTCTFIQLPDAVAIVVVPELDLPALCARHQPARRPGSAMQGGSCVLLVESPAPTGVYIHG